MEPDSEARDASAYERMIQINHRMIRGDEQNPTDAAELLAARSTPEQARRFHAGVGFPGNTDSVGRRMYPKFFIPPYNGGRKLKTVLGQTPKTHILSANMYELEILRLLSLLAPGNPEVADMISQTLARLITTCFGYRDDGVGECFDASLVVLRFLAAAAPKELDWMRSRMDNFRAHYADKKRPWFPLWYYWLCLSELPLEVALPEILRCADEIAGRLTHKSCAMNSETDRAIHPVLYCILRNLLSRLPEYAHIKHRRPYISPKDGRLHFNMGVSV